MSVTYDGTQKAYLALEKYTTRTERQAAGEWIWRQFVQRITDYTKGMGESINIRKILRMNSTATTPLDENQPIPSNNIKFADKSVVAYEYGNSIRYTHKAQVLAEKDIKGDFQPELADNYIETMEELIGAVAKTAKFRVDITGTGGTATSTDMTYATDGTAAGTVVANMSLKQFRAIIDWMYGKRVPKDGAYFNGILASTQISALYNDVIDITKYMDPKFRMNSEIGRVYDCRIHRDNEQLELDTLGTSTNYGEAVIFGKGFIGEVEAEKMGMYYTESDLRGRSKQVGWYTIRGFAKIWDVVSDDKFEVGSSVLKGVERAVVVNKSIL